MPVEIKELVIRAVVNDRNEGDEASPKPNSVADTEEIVEDCVRRVLMILKKSKER